MIYESEITKTMKGLLNSMAHRSNFSEKKLSSSMYLGKTEISIPLLGKKVNSKIFHIHYYQNHWKTIKIFKTIKNYHQQSTTVNSIGMMSSKMVDSSNSNRLTMKWQGQHTSKQQQQQKSKSPPAKNVLFIFLGACFLMGTQKHTHSWQPLQWAHCHPALVFIM